MKTTITICALALASFLCFAQEQKAPQQPNAAPEMQAPQPATNAAPKAVETEKAESAESAPAPAPAPASVATTDASPTPTTVVRTESATTAPSNNLMFIDYVKSDLKWKLGFRKEPYDKLSAHTADVLARSLETKELKKTDKLENGCCKIKIELLQVSTRQAIIKDPGIDVSANITISDAKDKVIYSKGYRGRSGTYFMNTWGKLIDHALENMVENMVKDDLLLQVLRNGKLPD